jgi:hypothetical protein
MWTRATFKRDGRPRGHDSGTCPARASPTAGPQGASGTRSARAVVKPGSARTSTASE